MKIGRILGMVGGLIAVVGVFLPWATATNTVLQTSESLSGIGVPIFGMLVLLFAVLGLVFVLVGKKGMCIGGMVMGILAFVFAMIVAAVWSSIIVTFGAGDVFSLGYGLYMSLIGSIVLIAGSVIALKEVSAVAPQMMPPPVMQQPIQ